MDSSERRQYPRLHAPVFCRPAGLRLHGAGNAIDIGLGGTRVFSDESAEVGTNFELELILPTGATLVCKAVVAWVEALPDGSPAKFDLGLRFTHLNAADREQLASVMAGE